MQTLPHRRLSLLALLTQLAFGQPDTTLKPFVMDHRNGSSSLIDVSFLLDAPAGGDGFIRVHGGHFVKPKREAHPILGSKPH